MKETFLQKEAPATHEYRMLEGHNRSDGSFKSSELLRAEYVQLTDNLINNMFEENEDGERVLWPDAVVFLDKSARPVSWLVRDLWGEFAADSEGNVPMQPEIKYVNIDREQWIEDIDPDDSGIIDVNKAGSDVIRSLRSIFSEPEHKHEDMVDSAEDFPTILDGKNIMIVDEVKSSGRTLKIAEEFFKAAFPDAQVRGEYWMRSTIIKNGATTNADLPVWYRDDVDEGRGVGPRLETGSPSSSPSLTQRLGAAFLSTAIRHPDEASRRLRQELSWLAEDANSGDMLVVPSLYRDDFDKRVDRYNNGMTIEEFKQRKAELG